MSAGQGTCLYCGVKREAFADDASWLEHWHRHAVEEREQRARQARQAMPPVLTIDTIPKRFTRKEREAVQRLRNREKARRWRARHPDRVRAIQRKYRQTHPDRMREKWRKRYARLKAEGGMPYLVRLRAGQERDAARMRRDPTCKRDYYWSNRDRLLSYKRANRESKSGYKSREDRALAKKARDTHIVMLREQGYTWVEIAERIGSTPGSVKVTYCATLRRRGQRNPSIERQKRELADHDALLLSTYHDGMSWTDLARLLGYKRGYHAQRAYLRALDRATRPDQQQKGA